MWAFSSCSKQGLLSCCSVQASHCSSFSYYWKMGSRVYRLQWNMGSRVYTREPRLPRLPHRVAPALRACPLVVSLPPCTACREEFAGIHGAPSEPSGTVDRNVAQGYACWQGSVPVNNTRHVHSSWSDRGAAAWVSTQEEWEGQNQG